MRKYLLASAGGLATAALAGTATLLVGGSTCSTCAQARSYSYPFGIAQLPSGSGVAAGTAAVGAPPYGTLTVTTPGLNSDTAVLDYSGVAAFLLSLLGANVNATSYSVGPISVQPAGPLVATTTTTATATTSPSYTTMTSGGTVGGFGMFSMLATPSGGSALGVVDAQVPLTDTSGTWADASSVLAPNAMGEVAVAGEATPLGQPFFAAAPASGGTVDPVSEPSTWLLLGAGVVGLGVFRLLPRGG